MSLELTIFRSFNHLILLLVICCLIFSCRKDPTQPQPFDPTKFSLTVEDVSCTDIWLRLKLSADVSTRNVLLKRDTTIIYNNRLKALDTLIADEGVQLNTQYTYKAELYSYDGKLIHKIEPIKVTTLDTTSHDFTWEITYLGDGNSSVLYDVAIINDTLAYAVGEIYIRDSTGQFETEPYNTAIWNGKEWKLVRTKVKLNYGTSIIYSYTALKSVFAFSKDDIWFVHNAGGVTRYNNGNWIMLDIPYGEGPGGANKIWGSSPNNLYFVGINGRITYFDGTRWRRLESGTDVDLLDIWGTPDGSQVWACGTNFSGDKSILLALQNKERWEMLWDSQNPTPPYVYQYGLSTLWTSGEREYFLSGIGGSVYRHSLHYLSRIIKDPGVDLGNYPYRLRGSARNNVMVVGDGAMVWHFNGISWKKYTTLYNLNDRLYGLAVSERTIITIGMSYKDLIGHAYIIIGRR